MRDNDRNLKCLDLYLYSLYVSVVQCLGTKGNCCWLGSNGLDVARPGIFLYATALRLTIQCPAKYVPVALTLVV